MSLDAVDVERLHRVYQRMLEIKRSVNTGRKTAYVIQQSETFDDELLDVHYPLTVSDFSCSLFKTNVNLFIVYRCFVDSSGI
jgi:hypothetical protein